MNRPTHDDFWLMCEVVQDLDSAADDGTSIERLVSPLVDPESLLYVACQRARRAQQAGITGDLESALGAMWMDAFLAGALFQKRKYCTTQQEQST